MKTTSKTKKQLVVELEVLQKRVLELEMINGHHRQIKKDFGERMRRCFTPMEQPDDAVYVIFDRKYEFINQTFAEMFEADLDEVCSPGFDPMTLIAPESRRFIGEKYREGIRGDFTSQQYEFIGLTKRWSKMECENFVLFIPYKWGIAMHGMIRKVSSVNQSVDKEIAVPQRIPMPSHLRHSAKPSADSPFHGNPGYVSFKGA